MNLPIKPYEERYNVELILAELGLVEINQEEDNQRLEDLLSDAINNNDLEEVKALINQGADVNDEAVKDKILSYACYRNDFDFIEYILDTGYDINFQNINGDTAIMQMFYFRVEPNSQDFLKTLGFMINKGADVNIANNEDKTPLHNINKYGIFTFVEKLLTKGFDINAEKSVNQEGDLPLLLDSDITEGVDSANDNLSGQNLEQDIGE